MSDKQSARDRALFLAMAALYEVANRADAGPIKPSLGLRALLAFLYLHSVGDKEPFVDFWREIQNPWPGITSRDTSGPRTPAHNGTGLLA